MDDYYSLTVPKDIQLALEMCEAVNCLLQATVQVDVKVGQLGRIGLWLCENCVSKFVGDD